VLGGRDRIDLKKYFSTSHTTALPYDVCPRVVGTTLQVKFWFARQSPTPWGDTAQGGTFTLPAGWDAPGEAGWYVGHLPTGGRTVYAHEFEGAPQPEPEP